MSTCGSGCGTGATSNWVPTPFCAAAAVAKYFALHTMLLCHCHCRTEWAWNPIDSGTTATAAQCERTLKAATAASCEHF